MPFIAQLLLGVAMQIVPTLLGQIFKKPEPKRKPTGIRQTLAVGGDEPLSFIAGRAGTAGFLEYVGTWGEVDDVPNAYLTILISVSDVPVRGLSRLFVNGEAVTIGGTHNSKGYPVTIPGDGGTRHMWIEFFDGTQTTADSFMLSKFPTGNRRWREDMIGRGIAYARITALFNRELFNGIPDFFFEVDGIELNDPRGDDAHDNPVVMIHQALEGVYFGDEWVWGLQGLPASRLHAANEAQMDKCDALVAKKDGGQEKRFRFGAEITVDQQTIDVIPELLESCNGRIAEIGGVYRVLVAEFDEAVVSFTDTDIVITETQSLSPFPGLEATYNAIDATYTELDERGAVKSAPRLVDTSLVAADDGRLLPAEVSLPMVFSGTQAQRLMSGLLQEHRRFRSHAITMPPEWWEYEVLDAAQWTSARNGYSGKDGIITLMDDLPNGNQFIGWKELDNADYSWDADSDEIDFDVVPLEIERPRPQVTTGFTAAPYTVVDDDGADRRAAIEVFWDGGLVDVRAVRIQIAETWDEERVIADVNVDYDREDLSPSRVIANPAILPAKTYAVRGIYLPFSGRATRWSNQDEDGVDGAWLTVTTPDVRVGPLDVYGLTLGTLAEEVRGQVAHIALTTRALLEQAQELATLGASETLANYSDHLQIRRELELAKEDVTATYREAITVAVGPGSAIVSRIEELEARNTEALAEAIDLLEARVDGHDAYATAITQVSAGTTPGDTNTATFRALAQNGSGGAAEVALQVKNGTFRTASLILRAPSNPALPTEVVIDAQYFKVGDFSTGAEINPLVYSGGVWRMNVANIGTVNAGLIQSFDGNSYWNLSTSAFRIATS